MQITAIDAHKKANLVTYKEKWDLRTFYCLGIGTKEIKRE